ncbi:MAG TPA: GerMN domain-containing protein [Thermoanaerobaculia bacterium]|nr:GerMN domain-containing protein [Thermoanaerobaculia bacterium]
MRRTRVVVFALLVLTAGCRKKIEQAGNLNVQNNVAPRAVRLYFEGPALLLMSEQRNVQAPQNPAGAMSIIVRELFKGPVNPAFARAFPADTVVRGAFLLPDGTGFVDLGGATLTQGWSAGSHEELIAVYSLVQTVTANFPEAKRVRILVNGTPAETLAGHLALDRALVPSAAFVDPRAR